MTSIHRIDPDATYAQLKASPVTWTTLGASGGGDGQIQAVILYKEVTNDSTHIPVACLDQSAFASLPLSTNGSDITLNFAATGVFRLT